MKKHLEKCPFNRGQTWYNYEYLETKLIETSRHLTIDRKNYSAWSEALADILVLTGNSIDTFFRKMFECPYIADIEELASIKKPINEWGIEEFRRYETYYELSKNKVFIPPRVGDSDTLKPFSSFSKDESPSWWTAYNKVKHEYYDNLRKANLRHVLNGLGALLILQALHMCSRRYLLLNGMIDNIDRVFLSRPLQHMQDTYLPQDPEMLRSPIGTTRWAGNPSIFTKIFVFTYRVDKNKGVSDPTIVPLPDTMHVRFA